MTKQERVMDVIGKAPVAVCTTINADGYPESRALLNLANREQYPGVSQLHGLVGNSIVLYFTTNTASSKMKQFAADPRTSMYYCLPDEFRGVWVSGDIEVVYDIQEKKRFWVDGWEMYYPKGYSDPDYAILRLQAKRIRGYENFLVFELDKSEL